MIVVLEDTVEHPDHGEVGVTIEIEVNGFYSPDSYSQPGVDPEVEILTIKINGGEQDGEEVPDQLWSFNDIRFRAIKARDEALEESRL